MRITSNGVALTTAPTEMRSSSPDDPQALRENLHRDGYVLLRQVLDRESVLALRGAYFSTFDPSYLAEGTAATEIAALSRSGLFTNAELLRLWSVTTPQTIFPGRRIGRLADGYEASFLVLHDDPLANIANTRSIVGRVKRGVALN